MDNIKNIHANYDAVLKDAFLLFKDKTLGFLDLDMPALEEPLSTENTEVVIDKSYADIAFRTAKNTGFLQEWEARISLDDLLRFAGYHVNYCRKYKMTFTTVIFTNKEPSVTKYEDDSLKFTPIIVNLGERDGDLQLAKIKESIAKGEPVNELELIYLPLYKSKDKSVIEVVTEVITLAREAIDDISTYQKVAVLTALVTNKFISEEEYKTLWEEIKMIVDEIKILKFARQDGIEEGFAKGKEEGIEEGIEQGIEQGIIKGIQEGFQQVFKVNKMLKEGKTAEEISKETGVPEDEILKIKNELN